MRIFKLDYLPEGRDVFSMGFEVYSGMTLPERGETILAVLPDKKVRLMVASEPDLSLYKNSLVCTFMAGVLTDLLQV